MPGVHRRRGARGGLTRKTEAPPLSRLGRGEARPRRRLEPDRHGRGLENDRPRHALRAERRANAHHRPSRRPSQEIGRAEFG